MNHEDQRSIDPTLNRRDLIKKASSSLIGGVAALNFPIGITATNEPNPSISKDIDQPKTPEISNINIEIESFFSPRDIGPTTSIIENGKTTGFYATTKNGIYESVYRHEISGYDQFTKKGVPAIRKPASIISVPNTQNIILPGLRPSFIPESSEATQTMPEPIISVSNDGGATFETHFSKPPESKEKFLDLGEFIAGIHIPSTEKVLLQYADIAAMGRGEKMAFEFRIFDPSSKKDTTINEWDYHIIGHGEDFAIIPNHIITDTENNVYTVYGRQFEINTEGYVLPKNPIEIKIDLATNKVVSRKTYADDANLQLQSMVLSEKNSNPYIFGSQVNIDKDTASNDFYVINTQEDNLQQINCAPIENKIKEKLESPNSSVFISEIAENNDQLWFSGFTKNGAGSELFFGSTAINALLSGEFADLDIYCMNEKVPFEEKPIPIGLGKIEIPNSLSGSTESSNAMLLKIKRYGFILIPTDEQGRMSDTKIFFPNNGLPPMELTQNTGNSDKEELARPLAYNSSSNVGEILDRTQLNIKTPPLNRI